VEPSKRAAVMKMESGNTRTILEQPGAPDAVPLFEFQHDLNTPFVFFRYVLDLLGLDAPEDGHKSLIPIFR
jgi:hypothetical protein